ncbi:kinase binding protein CGI-121-domain-containing protein [Gymnopilus junonius]|uniref:EKC/KEOPS complex subunit CGI121 n=1 Tax=Gymnopilus junonius TaxID=109634 RepID=A0A9P5NT75_GYMJU|nr:kinase binding protein CGI-121-domain-containing protein [Gymnopilus junonius]
MTALPSASLLEVAHRSTCPLWNLYLSLNSNQNIHKSTLPSSGTSLMPAPSKARIIAASTAEGDFGEKEREAVNFAFVDARLITSRLHLETAIYQAILAESQTGLRTRTVHAEILYNLNPTHNVSSFLPLKTWKCLLFLQITEAIRRYGVSDGNTDF